MLPVKSDWQTDVVEYSFARICILRNLHHIRYYLWSRLPCRTI